MNARLVCLAALFVGSALAPAEAVPQDILAGLTAEKFADREAAEERLRGWTSAGGPAAVDEVHRLYHQAADPEVSARCREVLRGVAMKEYDLTGVGYMGVQMDRVAMQVELPDGSRGVGIRLTSVQPDTPAERAGIADGDVLLGIDGRKWQEGEGSLSVSEAIKAYKPGSKISAHLLRGDKIVVLPLVLARRPTGLDSLVGGFFGEGLDELARLAEELDEREREGFFRRWLQKKRKNSP